MTQREREREKKKNVKKETLEKDLFWRRKVSVLDEDSAATVASI